jgi:hypothetical protein
MKAATRGSCHQPLCSGFFGVVVVGVWDVVVVQGAQLSAKGSNQQAAES